MIAVPVPPTGTWRACAPPVLELAQIGMQATRLTGQPQRGEAARQVHGVAYRLAEGNDRRQDPRGRRYCRRPAQAHTHMSGWPMVHHNLDHGLGASGEQVLSSTCTKPQFSAACRFALPHSTGQARKHTSFIHARHHDLESRAVVSCKADAERRCICICHPCINHTQGIELGHRPLG